MGVGGMEDASCIRRQFRQPGISVTLLYELREQRRCGDSLNSAGDAQTLWGFQTAFPLTCEGAVGEGEGVGDAGEC